MYLGQLMFAYGLAQNSCAVFRFFSSVKSAGGSLPFQIDK